VCRQQRYRDLSNLSNLIVPDSDAIRRIRDEMSTRVDLRERDILGHCETSD